MINSISWIRQLYCLKVNMLTSYSPKYNTRGYGKESFFFLNLPAQWCCAHFRLWDYALLFYLPKVFFFSVSICETRVRKNYGTLLLLCSLCSVSAVQYYSASRMWPSLQMSHRIVKQLAQPQSNHQRLPAISPCNKETLTSVDCPPIIPTPSPPIEYSADFTSA